MIVFERRKKLEYCADEARELLARELDQEALVVHVPLPCTTTVRPGVPRDESLIKYVSEIEAGRLVMPHEADGIKQHDEKMRFQVVAQFVNLRGLGE